MEFTSTSASSRNDNKLLYVEQGSKRESDNQQVVPTARNGPRPANLSFESSNIFRFESSSDLFAPIKFGDEELTAVSSSAESSDENMAKEVNTGDNNDMLSSPALSPSNQARHERDVSNDESDAASVSSEVGRTNELESCKACSRMEMLPLSNRRRKSSIEMFLSQSPSQALGGDFLKLSLDDRQMSLQASEHAVNGTTSVLGNKLSSSRNADSYTTGQFQLNLVQESSNEYISLDAHYRHQQSPAITQQLQDSYGPSGCDGKKEHLSALVSRSRSSTVPGTNAVPNTTYSGAYAMCPRIVSKDTWPVSQDGDSSAYIQEQMQDYYRNNQMAASYEQLQHRHQQHLQQYRPPQTDCSSYNYVGNRTRAPMDSSQWNPMVVMPHPPSAIYENGGNVFMNQRLSPMRYYHAQASYGPQQHGSMGIRGGGHLHSRAHGHNVYSRMIPPPPESSPPHSPCKSMHMGGKVHMGIKQCKFYLQGHCRMGSKCKFVHQADAVEHMGSASILNRQMYYQNKMTMSSPSYIMQQQRQQMNGDDVGHQVNVLFGGRQQSQMSYCSDKTGTIGMNVELMNGGGMNAPIMGGSAIDLSNLSATLSVEDIRGRVFAMSKDQNGCRLLQEQLDYGNRSDLSELIYRESLEHLTEMMVDPFGNYLFQKLLERVNEIQRVVIIRRVSSNLVAAALNLHGTRSVQKVVEVCANSLEIFEDDCEEEDGDICEHVSQYKERPKGSDRRQMINLPDIIVDALKDDAVRLCIDSNGNHVIQRALQYMKPEYNQFVFDAVCNECTTVGTHRHGCCVLQRCLDAANTTQKAEVIEQVERQAMKLMQDPYGNYVVQYVLDSCTAEEAFGVIIKPLGHIYELSVQKFSSNVIEKCLEKAPEQVRRKYIAEITSCLKMNKMLQDQFANYVVQRALCVCAEEQCLLLVKAIRPHLSTMKNTSGGRRITARILKRFPNMDISLDMDLSPIADDVFDHGGNGMMMCHLPTSSMGGYMQEQHQQQNLQPHSLQPRKISKMQGGHVTASYHFEESNHGNRVPQMQGNEDSMNVSNDVNGMGVNATSRV